MLVKRRGKPLAVLVGLPTRAGLREARVSLPLIRAEVVAALPPLLVWRRGKEEGNEQASFSLPTYHQRVCPHPTHTIVPGKEDFTPDWNQEREGREVASDHRRSAAMEMDAAPAPA